jgi:predicted NAD/FAD-dependent oxidoreductase
MAARVCVTGAGASGSLVASELAKQGHSIRLLDMGRGAGGRSATRITREGFVFDHGASFLKAHSGLSDETHSTLASLQQRGTLAPWNGRFGYIDSRNGFLQPHDPAFDDTTARECDFFSIASNDGGVPLVGVPKSSSIMETLASDHHNIHHQQARVTRLEWQPHSKTWSICGPTNSPKEGSASDTDEFLGEFDVLVLSDPMPLLPGFPGATAAATDDSHVLTPFRNQFDKLQRSAVFTLMLAFDKNSGMQEVRKHNMRLNTLMDACA